MDFFFEGLRKQMSAAPSMVDFQQAFSSQANELKEKAQEKEQDKGKKTDKDWQSRELLIRKQYEGKISDLQAENERLHLRLKSETARFENDIQELHMLVLNKDLLIEKLNEEKQELQKQMMMVSSPRAKQPFFQKTPSEIRRTTSMLEEDILAHSSKATTSKDRPNNRTTSAKRVQINAKDKKASPEVSF